MKRADGMHATGVAFAIALALSGCGGGGGDNQSASTPGEAQGVYAGSFSTTAIPTGIFSTLILENDEVWTLYGTAGSSGEFLVYGFIQGQGASNSGTFTATDLKDYNGATTSATLRATYQVGASFSGSVTEAGQAINFAGLAPAPGASSYVYNAAASLSDISGSWSGTNLSGLNSTFTVSPQGALSGMTDIGCGFSGNVQPRSSGKNVFDVSAVYNTSAACDSVSVSGLTIRGIGTSAPLAGGGRQLTIAMVSADRTRGGVVFAVR